MKAPLPPSRDPADVASNADPVALPLIEESLSVERVAVDRGGYRISKRVESRDEIVDEPLRRDEVRIERRKVGRTLAEGEIPDARYEGDTLVLPIVEEVVVLQKRLVLSEEVRVTRLSGTRRAPQSVTLRKEQVSIERLGPQPSAPEPSSPPRPSGSAIAARAGGHFSGERNMSSVVVALFDGQGAAEAARNRLLEAGFPASAIQMTDDASTSTTGSTSSASTPPAASRSREEEGPIARFFHELFGDDDDPDNATYTRTYGEAHRRGGTVLRVVVPDQSDADRAERLLNEAGAVNIDERSQQWREEGWTGRAAVAEGSGANTDAGETRTLKEIEEELKVGKRTVARGGVRIFSRMTEVPVEESIRLREEKANVQRRAVDRPATEADLAAFKEGSMEVRETSEEAVVSKSARVVGEVEIGKTVSEREETVRDTVRKTQVDVEPLEAGDSRGEVRHATDSGRASDTAGIGASHRTAVGSRIGKDSDDDSLAGTAAEHPVGTGVGAAAGAAAGGMAAGSIAAGAAAGSAAGPVGTVVGATVGAVAGGIAGSQVAENAEPDPSKQRKSKKPV